MIFINFNRSFNLYIGIFLIELHFIFIAFILLLIVLLCFWSYSGTYSFYTYIYIYIYNIKCKKKKMMQNNFTWYLKFHASGPTIFSQVQRSLKIYSIMISLICRHLCRVHFHRFRSIASASLTSYQCRRRRSIRLANKLKKNNEILNLIEINGENNCVFTLKDLKDNLPTTLKSD